MLYFYDQQQNISAHLGDDVGVLLLVNDGLLARVLPDVLEAEPRPENLTQGEARTVEELNPIQHHSNPIEIHP